MALKWASLPKSIQEENAVDFIDDRSKTIIVVKQLQR